MGQAPATGKISLRTVPRNFPGRSGTKEDQVYLCSPEMAATSALTGEIIDPRTLGMAYPQFVEPEKITLNTKMLVPPAEHGEKVELEKGPNIKPLPLFDPLPDTINGPVLLKVGDDISTDEIMPAGSRVLPYRSNIPEISQFVYEQIDSTFYELAMSHQEKGFIIVGGKNYGQGSSREHAAIAPRYLGLKVVIAKSFARIHFQNLINFGILPLVFVNPDDYDQISQYEVLVIKDLRNSIQKGTILQVTNKRKNKKFQVKHSMSQRQVEMILAGSLINVVRNEMASDSNIYSKFNGNLRI